ncbi:heat shock protein 23-like [Eupeodes corollae]|uniref:heat shock protein 23-like n=1 Tax=Eupeodes corollae TaxID=290404 RepID=UPI00249000A9|nr:heat shock protein 23-like [Eupeodes corollae]
MSVVPIMYDFEREMENFRKSMVSVDFAREMENFKKLVLADDSWFRGFPFDNFSMSSIVPLSFFHPPFFWRYPFQNHIEAALRDTNETMTINNDGFQLTFDVKEFKPNELAVKTVNNFLVIEGKHEERKDDHNFTKKHFSRTYLLPNGCNPDNVDSTISSDGVLCVKIPPPPPPRAAIECKERMVKIKQTGTTFPAIKA